MIRHAEVAGEPHALDCRRRTLVVEHRETFHEAITLIQSQIDAALLLKDRKRAHVLGCILGSLIATEKLCGFAGVAPSITPTPAGPVVERMLAIRAQALAEVKDIDDCDVMYADDEEGT